MISSRKVVLIDDDPDDHEIFEMAIAEASAHATCVHYDSAEVALDQLAKFNDALPDYIFLDLNMPRMNGMQFLELIKKDETLAQVPVIVYSTSILPSTKVQALQFGAFDFLAKPASYFELTRILKQLLLAGKL
jgi:CheY-like chemotaxis protein